ncbi:MAG: biosynthetic-type acetolactate synthase large subunit [Lachnospiraceae bacterium]|nr:biosynthetic-type acetolactate synthase large subunit [Lachnospiraceae bacterium]
MLLTGAEILIECLKEQGVDTVFGYPGGTALGVYDALYRLGGIKHILTSHEQGAAHAADGYARVTGRTGVCLVTSGPGATNLVTGIATAYMDSVPLVAITINVPTASLGKDSFQEVDIAGVTMPVTKHGFIVKDVEKLADTVRRAFTIAGRGRRGPVLVDIAKDVTQLKAEYERAKIESHRIWPSVDKEPLKQALTLIRRSKKPVILAGGGAVASGAYAAVKKLAQMTGAVTVCTLMGMTSCSTEDEEFLGMSGIHGTVAANRSLCEADLIIALGCRFNDRVTANPSLFAPHADLIQIDIDPAELNKNVYVTVAIAGDVKTVLTELEKKLKTPRKRSQWAKELIRQRLEEKREQGTAEGFTPANIVRTVSDAVGPDAVIVTEVGQNQMWTALNYGFTEKTRFITSGGLGTMGFGLGAAIGAKIGCPGDTVVNFAGDGCLRMNMNELATASAYHVPVLEILFKNNTLGMVRQWQDMFYAKRHSQTTLPDNVDYVKLAEAMGVKAVRVSGLADLKKAVSKAKKLKAPLLVVCDIKEDEAVWPMVIPGSSLERTFGADDFE